MEPPFRAGVPYFSSTGWYLVRNPEKLFALEVDGALVLIGSEARLERYRGKTAREILAGLGQLKPDFDDTDRFPSGDIPADPALGAVPLTGAHAFLLENFYAACSEEERDNVDVTLGEDAAWGLLENGALIGFSRYYLIPPDRKIADLGVIVRPDQRGRGLAKKLAGHAAHEAMKAGLAPRYRTNIENRATIAVADALAFKPAYRWRSFT